jgi:tryptophanyl-tRNA synthetase
MKKTALSGIQTSGDLHLGNYLGSIKNWINMQDDYNCLFFLADLHSITVEGSAEDLQKSTLNAIAIYLAAGLDPHKSVIFLQSSIKEHCELAWLLNCITPIGWLKRMTQFKDKAGKNQDSANTGLFTYPILMAADILLYNADIVPVGDDQKQHLELTRDIAGAINRKFNREILKVPEPLIQGTATRIMSLRDGTKKMSKSDASPASRINITDTAQDILQKIKKSKTDSIAEITYDPINRPEVTNLINIYSALTGSNTTQIVNNYQGLGFANFKSNLAEVIISEFSSINQEYTRLIQDKSHLTATLNEGANKARVIAEKTCTQIKDLFGFVNVN